MTLLFTHIKELIQTRETPLSPLKGNAMGQLPSIKNAYLYIEDDKIVDYGPMEQLPSLSADQQIDLSGQMVLPTWVDSHTHLVYAGNREQEFIDRINGLSYQEIAQRGGGILNSAKTLEATSEETLFEQSLYRLEQVTRLGTGAIEIKSGYGLSMEGELKMLRVIQRLKQHHPVTIKSTFLGAHALPKAFQGRKQDYIKHIIEDMLPVIAKEQLADFIDVFCEEGYFSVADMEQLLEAGASYGLRGKVHVNQFNALGGIQAAVQQQALSVDHLEQLPEEDMQALQQQNCIAVALPLCSHFLSIPYSPAKEMIAHDLTLALASDYNPGSTPSGNMNQVLSEACIKMKLNPQQAINAITINAAFAMDVASTHGSISKGKTASFIITKPIPSYGFLPYDFGNNNIAAVYLKGKPIF